MATRVRLCWAVLSILALTRMGVIRIGVFNPQHFRRVFIVAAVFQAKLVLDMSALVLARPYSCPLIHFSTHPEPFCGVLSLEAPPNPTQLNPQRVLKVS